uniref:Replication-associated protein n=1 Tax=Cressdnaviricota sp. TaxID=2748378 RepID=A0A6M9Z747_9VIRU|nr:MAG: replication-associated protein [Cressdnaviricota sp.]
MAVTSRTRNYVLTIYPKSEEEADPHPWDPNSIDWVQVKPAIKYFVCQLEECPTSKRLHWQCYVEFKNSVNFRNVQECKAWHKSGMCTAPHIERRKGTAIQATTYCSKDESCVDHDTRFVFGEAGVETRNRDQIYRDAMQCETYHEAIEFLRDAAPRDYVLHEPSIAKTLAKTFAKVETNPCYDWNFTVAKIPENYLSERAIVLMGFSGSGKTSYALSHFLRPVLVSHIDDLKKIQETSDGIVFDDMSFAHWPRTSCIHLLDLEHTRTINVRYGTISLPARMPRFFCTNETFKDLFNCKGTGGADLSDALLRRTKRYHIRFTLKLDKGCPTRGCRSDGELPRCRYPCQW